METQHVESLEEIIFKDRNKQYGAYSLRKKYNNHLIISMLLAVLFLGSALTYPVIMTREKNVTQKKDSVVIISEPFSHSFPDPVLPVPPRPPEPEKSNKNLAFTVPTVTSEPTGTDFGTQAILADNNPIPIRTNTEPDQQPASDQKPVIAPPEKPEPLLWVPEMPHFQGGEAELQKFLQTRIKYPYEAKEAGIQGTVFLTFVVEPDGSVTNISVLRGIGGGCDEEALRVVKNMPAWISGKQNGYPVRVKLTLPVKFTLHY